MLTLRDTTIIMLLESAGPIPDASGIAMPVIGSRMKPAEPVPEVANRCK